MIKCWKENLVFFSTTGFTTQFILHKRPELPSKSIKIPSMLLKLDFSKAYDKVSCTFIHLILIEIGLNLDIVSDILSCIQSTIFCNHSKWLSLKIFGASRGLSQGFFLSLFLFLLIAKLLRKIISKYHHKGKLKGLHITPFEVLMYLSFVDDVDIFGVGFIDGF